MIILSNTNAQTLAPGQSVVWDTVVRHTGSGECFRGNSSGVRLRASGCNVSYDISYSANIGATAPGQAQLALQIGGGTLAETTAISTTAAAGDLNNVSSGTNVGCCEVGETVVLTNTGTTTITVGADAVLKISRRS